MGFKNYNNTKQNDLEKESKKAEKLYNIYKDKSQDELIEELYKHVEKQKRDGTFNYEALSNMLNKLTPYLSEEQQQKMKEILEDLK